MNKKAIVELLKSAGRFLYFGILGLVAVALTGLVASLQANPELISAVIDVAGFKLSLGTIVVAVVGFLAKAIDLYVRKNKNIDSNGIAPTFLQK